MENKAEDRKFRLRVLTPMRVAYDKPVDMVILRTTEGDMGILRDHDTRTALLGDGVLRIFEDSRRSEELLMVLGGVLTVRDNDVDILSEIAEHPDNIQEYIAQLKAEKAASEIADQSTDLHTKRIEMAIRHALVHVDANTQAMLKAEDYATKAD